MAKSRGRLGVRQGQGARASARAVDHAPAGLACTREHGPAAGHRCLRYTTHLECRDVLSRRWRRFSASIARSKSSSGRPPSQRNRQAGSDRLLRRNPGIANDLPPDLPPVPGVHPTFAVVMNTNASTPVCWRELICSPAVHALVKVAIAAESSSNSCFSTLLIPTSTAIKLICVPTSILHAQAPLLAHPSSRASSPRSARSVLRHRVTSKQELKERIMAGIKHVITAAPSSTPGPTGSHRPPDMIRNQGNANLGVESERHFEHFLTNRTAQLPPKTATWGRWSRASPLSTVSWS